jgi:hypothetical protein
MTNIKSNMNRHKKNKHTIIETPIPNVINSAPDVINSAPDVINSAPDVINSAPNVIIYKCHKCDKTFTRNNKLNKHINICKGVSNILECHYCHNIFSSRQSKCVHIKKCKERIKQENNIPQTIINNTTNIINNGPVNNGTINNNTINIITFDSNFKNITPFKSDHIGFDELNNMLLNSIFNDNNIPKLLGEFYKMLCDNDENKCVKKTNFKSEHSKIHSGDGKWNIALDKDVYGKLVKDVSTNLINKIDENNDSIKNTFKKQLLKNVEILYETIETYTEKIYDEEKDLLKILKDIIKRLKYVVIDYTK